MQEFSCYPDNEWITTLIHQTKAPAKRRGLRLLLTSGHDSGQIRLILPGPSLWRPFPLHHLLNLSSVELRLLLALSDTCQEAGSRCPELHWRLIHHPDDSSPMRRSQGAAGFQRSSSPRNQFRRPGRLLRVLSLVNRSIETAKGRKAELNGSFLLAAMSSEFGRGCVITRYSPSAT